jgi:DnaJ-class molecular chaperone
VNNIDKNIKSDDNKDRKIEHIIEAWKIIKDPESRKIYDNELKGNTS